jgi:hypothetical protein
VFGLLPFAPQLVLGVVAILLPVLWFRSAGAALVASVLVYEFVALPYGFRGDALPARFQIVLIPFLALAVALLLDAHRRVIPVFVAAAVLSAAFLVQGGRQPTYGALYHDGSRPNLPWLRSVASALPDFSVAPGHTGATFTGAELHVAPPSTSRLFATPVVTFRRGHYDVTVAVTAARGTTVVVAVESPRHATEQRVSRSPVIEFPLTVDRSGTPYQFEIAASDPGATLRARRLSVRAVSGVESRTAPSRRDLPLGIAWFLAMIGAALIATIASRFRSSAAPPRPEPAVASRP